MAPVGARSKNYRRGNQHFHSPPGQPHILFPCLKHQGFPRSSTPRRRSGSLCLTLPHLPRPEGPAR